MHVQGLPGVILRESVSVIFQMTLYSSTAIHGHCQVQCVSLCVSTVGHDAAGIGESDGEMKSGMKLRGMQKIGSDRGESERKQLGQGCVGYGK